MLFKPEICVQNVNKLSCHQMIQTDQDGFALKPQGILKILSFLLVFLKYKHIINSYPLLSLPFFQSQED